MHGREGRGVGLSGAGVRSVAPQAGALLFQYCPAGLLCCFVRGISYLGDALYIFVTTLLKNGCALPDKGLCVFLPFRKAVPQRCGGGAWWYPTTVPKAESWVLTSLLCCLPENILTSTPRNWATRRKRPKSSGSWAGMIAQQ